MAAHCMHCHPQALSQMVCELPSGTLLQGTQLALRWKQIWSHPASSCRHSPAAAASIWSAVTSCTSVLVRVACSHERASAAQPGVTHMVRL